MTLLEMLEKNAERYPEKTAIIYQHCLISYQELQETVLKVAKTFRELGIKKGDRVGLMVPRIPELIISFFGSILAQAIVVPINFERLDKEIGITLSDIAPRCLIVHAQFLELARRAIPPHLKIMLMVVGEGKGKYDLSWSEVIEGKTPEFSQTDITEEDIAYLNYTSGSTGKAKGAITTHSNIYWNTLASVDAFRMTPDDVHLCIFAPFAHPHELFSRPFYLGGTIVLVDNIFPKSLLDAIQKYRVTCIMGLAPMYNSLLEVLEQKSYEVSSLRILESGGMRTNGELIERCKKKIGTPILPVWGSTETTGIAISNRPDEKTIPGSIGKPCLSYEIEIVDENGVDLPPGEIGEFIFKGPGVVQGYYEEPYLSHGVFKNGWYYSGDLGKRDEENNFFFVDRKSGMMKIAGLKVYPLEIELVMMEHPDIKEVAVIPTKDKLRGEVPKAIIVPGQGKNLTEKEVIQFCRQRLPTYKVPRLVVIREDLPKFGGGKIDKKALET
jgi:long-chain acyl-CoA synthetase